MYDTSVKKKLLCMIQFVVFYNLKNILMVIFID